MHTNVKATNFSLNEEVSDFIDKKLKILDKLIDSDDTTAMCDIEIGKSTEHHQKGDIFRAELNVRLKGDHFRAVAERDTLNAAIVTARDEMARELRRHKQKRSHFFRKGGMQIKSLIRGFWKEK